MDIFCVFRKEERSVDRDYGDDGFIIVWDSEEFGRNMSTSDMIAELKKYDDEIYDNVLYYCKCELELPYPERKEDLDNSYFDEVFDYISEKLGDVWYKFYYQTISVLDCIYDSEEGAKGEVEYKNSGPGKREHYYCRYKLISDRTGDKDEK